MVLDVTVLTPSIPARRDYLIEAIDSVQRQSSPPAGHLIAITEVDEGPAMSQLVATRNRLAECAETTWVATLDDDDYYLPDHFTTVAPMLEEPVDVIYSYPDNMPGLVKDVTAWGTGTLLQALSVANCIPSNACIRVEALWAAGGWSTEGWDPDSYLYWDGPVCAEDWDLWLRLARIEARFVCVPVPTWHYRRHETNLTDRANAIKSRTKGQGVMLHG
jgi:hypothetical protein